MKKKNQFFYVLLTSFMLLFMGHSYSNNTIKEECAKAPGVYDKTKCDCFTKALQNIKVTALMNHYIKDMHQKGNSYVKNESLNAAGKCSFNEEEKASLIEEIKPDFSDDLSSISVAAESSESTNTCDRVCKNAREYIRSVNKVELQGCNYYLQTDDTGALKSTNSELCKKHKGKITSSKSYAVADFKSMMALTMKCTKSLDSYGDSCVIHGARRGGKH
jgi:hypothetical protein